MKALIGYVGLITLCLLGFFYFDSLGSRPLAQISELEDDQLDMQAQGQVASVEKQSITKVFAQAVANSPCASANCLNNDISQSPERSPAQETPPPPSLEDRQHEDLARALVCTQYEASNDCTYTCGSDAQAETGNVIFDDNNLPACECLDPNITWNPNVNKCISQQAVAASVLL